MAEDKDWPRWHSIYLMVASIVAIPLGLYYVFTERLGKGFVLVVLAATVLGLDVREARRPDHPTHSSKGATVLWIAFGLLCVTVLIFAVVEKST